MKIRTWLVIAIAGAALWWFCIGYATATDSSWLTLAGAAIGGGVLGFGGAAVWREI